MICLRKTLRCSLLLLFSLSICSVVILFLFRSGLTLTSYALTLHYTVLFLLGALIAKYKNKLIVFIVIVLKTRKLHGFICDFTFMYEGLIGEMKVLNNFIFRDYVVAISASLFVILSLSISTLSSLLRNKYLLYLGKISYSLYLYHIISLFSLIYMLHEILPLPIILIFHLFFVYTCNTFVYICRKICIQSRKVCNKTSG